MGEFPNPEFETKSRTFLDPESVYFTEENWSKATLAVSDTIKSVSRELKKESGREIPPIFVLKSPYTNIEDAEKAFKIYINTFRREKFPEEDIVLKLILNSDGALCYNGHRRLEAHKNNKRQISAVVIESQDQFNSIPVAEKRYNKDSDIIDLKIDQNYKLTFLRLLNDAVCILCKERQSNGIDTKMVLDAMHKRRSDSK